MTRTISTLLELAGLAAFVVGIWAIDWRAGVAALGVVAFMTGMAMDPPQRELPQRPGQGGAGAAPGRYDE
jgi:hypothetical protein